ncbi:hypothetical protein BCR37DRAFT_352584 [Protomyces lactucae-debilis]|uniref:Uncharacterized protein n=1 Tax=Protomyces lactucae-debilis TaxID=2754530 RepID=A0A1Y2EUN4_PROLT|nr:uncharacterized protein BCR37DRAFT_352584 [Protomyces lactucae-debilis]ORY74565.1 hypothetical protein BCR37DRAFT_352584 [Protomyces lactucae-debilis]
MCISLSSSGALSERPEGASYRSSGLAISRWTEALRLRYQDHGLVTSCAYQGAIESIPDARRRTLPHEAQLAENTLVWLAAQRQERMDGKYVSCSWDMEEFLVKRDDIVEKN